MAHCLDMWVYAQTNIAGRTLKLYISLVMILEAKPGQASTNCAWSGRRDVRSSCEDATTTQSSKLNICQLNASHVLPRLTNLAAMRYSMFAENPHAMVPRAAK